MEFMQFEESTEMQNNAIRFNNKDVFPAKLYTWETIEQAGFAERFEQIICPTYPGGFQDTGLKTIFFMDHPVYKPILVEFLTSFVLKDYDYSLNLNKEKLISFRLCGQYFNISLCTFAQYLGLVSATNTQEKKAYLRHLQRATPDLPPDYNFDHFWSRISNLEYGGSNCRESHLKDPVVRLLHRYLSWSLCFNNEGSKCNQNQIHAMYHCLNRDHRWHIPLAVAQMFMALKKQPQKLPGGQFVTRIAINAGLLTGGVTSMLGQRINATIVPLSNMALSYLLKRVGEDTYEQYEIGEDVQEEVEPAHRNRGKRSRRAPGNQAGSSSQAPPEYSNRYVVEQNNILGTFVGDLSNLVYNADRRAEMRDRSTYVGPYPTAMITIGHHLKDGRQGWQG